MDESVASGEVAASVVQGFGFGFEFGFGRRESLGYISADTSVASADGCFDERPSSGRTTAQEQKSNALLECLRSVELAQVAFS